MLFYLNDTERFSFDGTKSTCALPCTSLGSYLILLFAVTSRKFWPWKVRLATTKVDDGTFLLALSGEWFETTAYSVSIELEGGDFAMWRQGCKCISLWYFGCPISSEIPRLGTFWLIWKLRRDSMTLLQCVYPLGVAKNANLIVSRKATEVTSFSNLKRKRKKRPKQSESEVRCSIFHFLKFEEEVLSGGVFSKIPTSSYK